jgi:hypothetical protein
VVTGEVSASAGPSKRLIDYPAAGLHGEAALSWL